MAFRWFRQNKQATKWLYIGITVFVMVTFTVTGAMLDGLSDDSGERLAGRFETKGGKTVEVTEAELRNVSFQLGRLTGGRMDDDAIWQFMMLDALSKEAGIVVGDDMLHDYIRTYLSSGGIQTKQQYEGFLRMFNLTAPAFEELMRRQARIGIYQQLADDPPRVLSERIYERFKADHEEFQVDYVAFSDDALRAELASVEPSEEELRTFYADEMSPVRKANDFSTPERYGLDAAVLDLATADVQKMRELLPENQRQVSDAEIQSFYDRHLDRYRIEDADAADATDGSGDEETSEGEETSGDEEATNAEDGADEEGADGTDAEAEEETERYRELAEVRGDIEKELLATRLVNLAVGEYNEKKVAREREKAAEDAAQDQDPIEESGDAASEEEAAEPDLLQEIAERFGLEVVDFGEPMLLEGIADLDRIGGEDLESVRFLPEGGVRPRHPTDDVPFAAVVRMKEKVAAQPKPFEEVASELPEAWREETAQKRAEARAKEFWDALSARARASVESEVAQLEKEAADLAAAMIEKDAVEDEAKQQEIRDRELEAMKPRIEALLTPHRGEHFAAVADEQGVPVESIDWFRKSYRSTAFYRDDPAGPAKFLKGHFPLFDTEVGGVVGPLRDPTGKTSLVAKVTGRRFPEPSDMTLRDRDEAARRVQQEIDPDSWMRQMGRASPFDFEKLAGELRLERFEDRRPEGEEEDAAPSN